MLRGITTDTIPIFFGSDLANVIAILEKFGRYLLNGQYVVDEPGRGGALRHSAHGGARPSGCTSKA
jgi:hypothetical protein